ncbi:TetR/AcrR family transcriptional regulator [Acidovorax sp.]|uniref:TetR/AcrR family transcriptional regulator n=1 Tax=Acidovorax sp. TaxID=1872122 RepID=UPI00391EEADA
MKIKEPTARRRKGRPLSFDRDVALNQAMQLVWQHVYYATSLNDLTTALGVTPSSIYTVFGDKKGLFLAAVERYVSGGPVTSQGIIDGAATARDAAWGRLQAAAIGSRGADTPAGCLLASSAISCSDAASEVKETLAGMRRGIEAMLEQRIAKAIASGELPRSADANALAGHVMAVIQGISTLARDGAPREKLLRVAATAMQAWPGREGADAADH